MPAHSTLQLHSGRVFSLKAESAQAQASPTLSIPNYLPFRQGKNRFLEVFFAPVFENYFMTLMKKERGYKPAMKDRV
jgi:hypothetical protein